VSTINRSSRIKAQSTDDKRKVLKLRKQQKLITGRKGELTTDNACGGHASGNRFAIGQQG